MRRKEDAEKRVKENVRLPKLQVKEFRGDPLESGANLEVSRIN